MPDPFRGPKRLFASLVAALLLAGCAGPLPQPWEKGLLARPDMAMDSSGLEARFGDHVYSSREGASGSGVAGGASCGCN
jgi:hypothetical protein